MYSKLLLGVISFTLIACQPHAPYWTNVCVQEISRTELRPTSECGLSFDGKGYTCGHFALKMVTVYDCVQYKRVCVKDKYWKGQPQTCENLDNRQ